MLTMDVFNEDAFSAVNLTMAVDRYGYVPTLLQTMSGLYVPAPVSTEKVWIESRDQAPALIQTSARGTPPKQKGGDHREARDFNTTRIAQSSRITASELQNIRAFGQTSEFQSLQMELGRRTMKIVQDFTLTKEHRLLAMVQGLDLDADGSVIYDWSDEFGQAQPGEVSFGFSATVDDGSVRLKCNAIKREIIRNLKGMGGIGVHVVALCSDEFYDALVTSGEVRDTFKNYAAAADLRASVGATFQAFVYADITFINYRGTDDNSLVSIPSGKAKFFPVNAGIFQKAQAPGESFEWTNTPGRELYARIVMDIQRNTYADIEYYSYPLFVCVQPSALASGSV